MRAEITARDIWCVLAVDRRDGAAVAALKYSEALYRALLARRWRRLRPKYFAHTPTGDASPSRIAS
jgi:hypothetical protein